MSKARLDERRLGEILDVATEVFISKGFAAASTNEIARQANASKGTFYSRFPTKEALFLAVLERRMQMVFTEMADALPSDAPVEETLRRFGSRFLTVALSESQIGLLRVVSMEARNFPELAKRFYELGPKRGQEILAEYLQRQTKSKHLAAASSELMAQQFLSLLGGGPIRWTVLGLDSKPLGKAQIISHIENTLDVFMRAYGVSTKSNRPHMLKKK